MFKRIHYNSPIILTFTFISFAVLLLDKATGGFTNNLLFTNFRTSIKDPLQYLRLFSYILGHANLSHFSGNFLIILLVGPMVEEKYGSSSLLEMILVTAFLTGIINTLFFSTGLLGASGIVFMLILLSSFANAQSGKIPLTLIIVTFVFVGKEIINGLLIKDNISQFAHIFGGFCGGIFGYLRHKGDLPNI